MTEILTSCGPRSLRTPVPVRFVHNDRFGAAEAARSEDLDALLAQRGDILAAFAENGDLCWTVQTFCRLREAGYGGIELATEPASGRINLSKAKTLSRRGWRPGTFDVSIQADYPRVVWAQFHLQQNRDLEGHHSAFVPLWPQAGLTPRDAERMAIERAAFIGKVDGNLAGGVARWKAMLQGSGIEFVAPPPGAWHDLSAIDVVVALRSFDGRRHSRKPANKLVNAWRAGVPFIGGADSAYSQAGSPGVDYLQARSPAEVLAQLERLRHDPGLYRALVEAGRKRSSEYSVPNLVHAWLRALEGPVAARYLAWAAHPRQERLRSQLMGAAQSGLDAAKAVGRRLLRRAHEA